MNQTNGRRLARLENTMLEVQLARLKAHMRGLSDAELDLLIGIEDSLNGVDTRQYSAEEIATFERHRAFQASFSDAVFEEHVRRAIAELLATGQMTRAEIIERWGAEFLPQNETRQKPPNRRA